MRKNRKKQPIGKIIIIASSIITLNLFGVSYAQWNDNIDMTVSVSTGYIKPFYIGDEVKIVGNSKGDIDLDTSKKLESSGVDIVDEESLGEITAKFKNANILEITGWCYPTYNKNIFVRIGNDGTIPITYKGMEAEEDDEIIKQIQYNGSNIKENDRKMKLRDQDLIKKKDEKEIKIHIQAENENDMEYGNRSFTYQLQFEQGVR
jgi:cytochrome c oxidase assembly protein Cox11